jgi:copper homeostasis protein
MVDSHSSILVEVCVGSVADVQAAMAAGAGRVELCSAMELGGLTPSMGLVEAALAVSSVPVVVMLRPRAGGFYYDEHEFASMRRDARMLLEAGAAGIVFGMLGRDGAVDANRLRELVEIAGSADTVFHRAFDFVSDQLIALDVLREIGCKRVLTSGGRATAIEGAEQIRRLVDRAAGGIEILPGGGVNARNAAEVVQLTRCTQIHIGASGPSDDGSIGQPAPLQLCDGRYREGFVFRTVVGGQVEDVVRAVK